MAFVMAPAPTRQSDYADSSVKRRKIIDTWAGDHSRSEYQRLPGHPIHIVKGDPVDLHCAHCA